MLKYDVISWLLEGDETILYQTNIDLLNAPLEILSEIQNNVTIKGWGKRLLEKQDPLTRLWGNQGKVRKDRYQDLCVSAMILSICSYAQIRSPKINEIVDYILDKQYLDGGWNCR
jgi:hypothetical protein